MEIVDRYVYAVTQRVPQQQRTDIEKELRGLIEDMLDDKQVEGETAEGSIEAVLLELGSPIELAAKYRGYKKYIIGPELYESYLIVVRIVLISIAIGLTVVLGIEIAVDPIAVQNPIKDYFGTLISACMEGFAWVTIAFILIEHRGNNVAQKSIAGIKKEWKPSDLAPIPNEKSRIRRGRPIASIIFTMLFVMVFTFSTEYIGIIRLHGETTTVSSFLNPDVFRSYLPFIWVLALFIIIKEGIKLVTGRWTRSLILLQMVYIVASFLIAVIMLMDQSLWNLASLNELLQSGLMLPVNGSATFETSSELWQYWSIRLIYIVAIITIIETIVVIVKAYGMKKYSK